ncbi:hypothetical protein HMPREF9071_0892 [Capnocytophaga sp. oral taxon 338 str. F0234]|nr:hypothetical protein HMPREF9071_0892 [Capnocytophaga sp. oral taxon 338 str. F0234]
MKKLYNINKIFLFLYWGLLSYMLLRPSSSLTSNIFFFTGADKLVHFLIFALLAFLYERVFPKQKRKISFFLMILYAIFTEVAQEMMPFGRSGEIGDLFADILGIFFGYYTLIVYNYINKSK